jgi:mono/diheme cytochrome c family protein
LRSASASLLVLALALGSAPASAAERFDLPQGKGRDLVYGQCQTCHDLQSVLDSKGIRRGAWDAVLDNMKEFGLRISDAQRAAILDYLGTYLGPNPPPAASEAVATAGDGAVVFENTCSACHQPDGKGSPGQFPPLAANPDVFLASDFPAAVALNGIEGPITVEGQSFDKVMPAFDFLSDAEIAAVVTYVRSNWGNGAARPSSLADLTPDDVATLRKKPMTPAEVHDYRASLKK